MWLVGIVYLMTFVAIIDDWCHFKRLCVTIEDQMKLIAGYRFITYSNISSQIIDE